MLGALRDPDRDCDLAGRAEVDLVERVRQPAAEVERVARVAGRHHDAELLAAEAADDVRAAQRAAEKIGEVAKHLVAGPVAVDVVDPLEVVDVEHQHRDGVPRPARAGQLGAQALMKVAVVVEAGEGVGLGLVLEPRPDLRVVERQRGRVGEAGRELELVVAEGRVLAEAVDVEHPLDQVAGDQRDGDQRFRLVGRRSRHRLPAGVEVGLVRPHRLAMERSPAGDALAEVRLVAEDVVRPLVAREHGDQHRLRLVRLVDRERVVGDELRKGVRDPLEQVVEAVLREDVVEDVGELAVRLHERRGTRSRRLLVAVLGGRRDRGSRTEMPHPA